MSFACPPDRRTYPRPHALLDIAVRSAALAGLLTAASCGKQAPKPADADIAAYLAQSQPPYLRLGNVSTSYEAPSSLSAAGKLPEGSWRVHVKFTLRATQDLYEPTPATLASRAEFDRAVAVAEQYRLPRIAAVNQLGQQAGLVAPGATSPEPALTVAVLTRKDQDRPDEVTLLAEPQGHGWSFIQLDAQTLSDTDVGAPLDDLRHSSPHTVFVTDGSEEARSYAERERRFLTVLAKVPPP